jgi:hypothetical protein
MFTAAGIPAATIKLLCRFAGRSGERSNSRRFVLWRAGNPRLRRVLLARAAVERAFHFAPGPRSFRIAILDLPGTRDLYLVPGHSETAHRASARRPGARPFNGAAQTRRPSSRSCMGMSPRRVS